MLTRSEPRITLLLIFALGAGLRLWTGLGDVWFDEIWSLIAVRAVDAPHEVFTRWISDNNHHLNSLYLYMVRNESNSLILRGSSIFLGAISAPAAYWAARPYGRRAGLLFAVIVATAFPFVLYGSEARGYAGLILCSLIALGLAERHLRSPNPACGSKAFACILLIGLLFHLTMLISAVSLGIWVIWVRYRQERGRIVATVEPTYVFFKPAIIVTLIFIAAGILLISFQPGTEMEIGGSEAFRWHDLDRGLGQLLRHIFGTSAESSVGLLVGLFIIGNLITIAVVQMIDRHVLILVWSAVVIVPLSMALAAVPNMVFSRYFFMAGISTAFWISILIANSGRAGALIKFSLYGTGALFIVGQAHFYSSFADQRRGAFRAAISDIRGSNELIYSAAEPQRTVIAIDYFQSIDGSGTRLQNASFAADDCTQAPAWHIIEMRGETLPAPMHLSVVVDSCELNYARFSTYPHFRFSGLSWALYRRVEPLD